MIHRTQGRARDEDIKHREVGPEGGEREIIDMRTMKRPSTINSSWREWEKQPGLRGPGARIKVDFKTPRSARS